MADLRPRADLPASSLPPRKLIASGFVRRTAANARLAELHRACRADWASNEHRRAQDHRDDAFLTNGYAEAARSRR
ncbi:hypothetical protein AB0E06_10475 [Streptomyces sp. NPDC048109]|uniref:hypothetical protein n=1 Tax=Streptomyces sp. NPDC048109 TaxID=3155482 RepID=UPI00342E7523